MNLLESRSGLEMFPIQIPASEMAPGRASAWPVEGAHCQIRLLQLYSQLRKSVMLRCFAKKMEKYFVFHTADGIYIYEQIQVVGAILILRLICGILEPDTSAMRWVGLLIEIRSDMSMA